MCHGSRGVFDLSPAVCSESRWNSCPLQRGVLSKRPPVIEQRERQQRHLMNSPDILLIYAISDWKYSVHSVHSVRSDCARRSSSELSATLPRLYIVPKGSQSSGARNSLWLRTLENTKTLAATKPLCRDLPKSCKISSPAGNCSCLVLYSKMQYLKMHTPRPVLRFCFSLSTTVLQALPLVLVCIVYKQLWEAPQDS